jgi:ribosomal protein S21
MVNAEVSKSGNESPLAVIRKFSRRVQGTGLIQRARKRRYFERTLSKTVSKKKALKRIKRHTEFRKLVKEGKVAEAPVRRGGYRPASQTPRENAPAAPARFGEDTPIAR